MVYLLCPKGSFLTDCKLSLDLSTDAFGVPLAFSAFMASLTEHWNHPSQLYFPSTPEVSLGQGLALIHLSIRSVWHRLASDRCSGDMSWTEWSKGKRLWRLGRPKNVECESQESVLRALNQDESIQNLVWQFSGTFRVWKKSHVSNKLVQWEF